MTAMVAVAAVVAAGVMAVDAPEKLTCAVGGAVAAVSGGGGPGGECGDDVTAHGNGSDGSPAPGAVAGRDQQRSGEVSIQSIDDTPTCTEVAGTTAMTTTLTWCTFPTSGTVTVCTDSPALVPGDPQCGTSLQDTTNLDCVAASSGSKLCTVPGTETVLTCPASRFDQCTVGADESVIEQVEQVDLVQAGDPGCDPEPGISEGRPTTVTPSPGDGDLTNTGRDLLRDDLGAGSSSSGGSGGGGGNNPIRWDLLLVGLCASVAQSWIETLQQNLSDQWPVLGAAAVNGVVTEAVTSHDGDADTPGLHNAMTTVQAAVAEIADDHELGSTDFYAPGVVLAAPDGLPDGTVLVPTTGGSPVSYLQGQNGAPGIVVVGPQFAALATLGEPYATAFRTAVGEAVQIAYVAQYQPALVAAAQAGGPGSVAAMALNLLTEAVHDPDATIDAPPGAPQSIVDLATDLSEGTASAPQFVQDLGENPVDHYWRD